MEIGKKIRELRMRKGLTQEELANRSELSKGFISQLENDVTSPSIATLVDVLTCLGTDLKTFFGEEQVTRSSSVRKDYFVKTDEAQGNEIAWIVRTHRKTNGADPADTAERACTEVDSPHEGEESATYFPAMSSFISGTSAIRRKKARAFTTPPPVTTIWKTRAKRPLSFSGSVHRLIFRFPHRVIFTKNGAPK